MKDTLVIDFETKKSFAEVGGEEFKKDLGISVAGVYSYNQDTFFAFEEHEIPQFEEMLSETDHLIGFNSNHFDLPVLQPYLSRVALEKIPSTDMFVDASTFLGHRIGLNALAKATLKVEKSGHGLEALEWFKQGRIEEVKKYCLDDVRITRDLYEYGKKNGHVLFESRVDGKIHSIPVQWNGQPTKPVALIIEEMFAGRRRVAIEYISSEDNEGSGYKKQRQIDIYRITGSEIEAYCHLRQGVRKFRVDRILKAVPTEDVYVLPQDVQGALF